MKLLCGTVLTLFGLALMYVLFAWATLTAHGNGKVVDCGGTRTAKWLEVRSDIDMFTLSTGRLPKTLDELLEGGDPTYGPYAKAEDLVDQWGARVIYTRQAKDYQLTTLGSDGKPGGDGDAEDITQYSCKLANRSE